VAELPPVGTPKLWEALRWTEARITRTGSQVQPLVVEGAPRAPGLYRMSWVGPDWARLGRVREVQASSKVADPILDLSSMTAPVELTVGRSLNLYERLRQHFGTNSNNNRVWSRLRALFQDDPNQKHPEDQLRALVAANVQVQWVTVDSWVERCLLERYGCSVLRPVLDLDAEH
jgi:hypothetical protein